MHTALTHNNLHRRTASHVFGHRPMPPNTKQCHSHDNKINLVVVLLCPAASLGGSFFRIPHGCSSTRIFYFRQCVCVVVVKLSRWNADAYENSFIRIVFCHSSGFENGPYDDLRRCRIPCHFFALIRHSFGIFFFARCRSVFPHCCFLLRAILTP